MRCRRAREATWHAAASERASATRGKSLDVKRLRRRSGVSETRSPRPDRGVPLRLAGPSPPPPPSHAPVASRSHQSELTHSAAVAHDTLSNRIANARTNTTNINISSAASPASAASSSSAASPASAAAALSLFVLRP